VAQVHALDGTRRSGCVTTRPATITVTGDDDEGGLVTARMTARLHTAALATWWRLRDERGQGTVEYVGMVVMVTLLVAAVAVAAKGWAPDIGEALKKALTGAITHLTDGFG